MLLPTWFPFHLDKISYWARTVDRAAAGADGAEAAARKNPRGVGIDELFVQPPADDRHDRQGAASEAGAGSSSVPRLDAVLRDVEPLFAEGAARQRAIDAAVAFVERAAERRGRPRRDLSGRWPTRVMMYDVLGYPEPIIRTRAVARRSARQAAGDRRARGLLPALRVAGLGHRADLPRPARSRRRTRRWRRPRQGAGLAASRCRCST